jgi:3D (Asp-Asp-Asp) domain-containing protein
MEVSSGRAALLLVVVVVQAMALEVPTSLDLGLPPPALVQSGTVLPMTIAAPSAIDVCFAGRAYRRLGDTYLDDAGNSWKPLRVTTTAYVPVAEQCDGDPERTATGTAAQITYGVAADPRALPYGSLLRIPGYGDVKVDDTGSRMVRSWQRSGDVLLDLRIPLRRADGVWRDAATCNRIAMKHGIQRDRIVLVRVPDATVAALEQDSNSRGQ